MVYPNFISSLWKMDREMQWKAIYPANMHLFTQDMNTIWYLKAGTVFAVTADYIWVRGQYT